MIVKAASQQIVTRFAPSPTGRLHLGHAYSALTAFEFAQERGGQFVLRMENIDQTRCTEAFEQGIIDDLHWLGMNWDGPVRRQSEHLDDYAQALARLKRQGLIYPCFCTRRDIRHEIARSAGAPHGPEGHLYPGSCRRLSADERQAKITDGMAHAWRLDMAAAMEQVNGPLYWHDHDKGEVRATPEIMGDVVLARKETPTSYHLACTLDDHLQGITHVIRGNDLFHAAHLHRLLQALLGLETPRYHHHALLVNTQGERLAKRDEAATLDALRQAGYGPDDVRSLIKDNLAGQPQG